MKSFDMRVGGASDGIRESDINEQIKAGTSLASKQCGNNRREFIEKICALFRELADKQIPKEIKARAIIGHVDAGSEIIRLAVVEDADLIVIAKYGSTGWRHFIFSSVAEKVAQLAERPALTVWSPNQ